MNERLCSHVRLAFLVLVGSVVSSAVAAQQAPPSPPSQTAEKRFKNIQVLTGIPVGELYSTMHFMRASLGVRCAFCHVVEGEQYERDDKRQKQTARRMIQMVLEINKNNFDDRTQVTCNTCHRGSSRPVSLVPIGQGVYPDTTGKFISPPAETLPSPAQVLDGYIQALGGEAKLLAVRSRSMRGEVLGILVESPGTPKANAINRGASRPLEVDIESGKFFVQFQSPAGDIRQVSDGTSAWAITPQGRRAMTPAEVARIQDLYDPQAPLRWRELAPSMTVEGSERIGATDTYVLACRVAGGRLQRWFFAKDSGLLLRRTTYTQMLLGLDPVHLEFEDYRDVGGVLVPFTLNFSYIDDNHYGNTRRFTEIRNNVKIDAARFSAAPQQ